MGCQGQNNGLIKTDPNGELDKHGNGTAGGANSRFLHQSHLLLSQQLLVFSILLLKLSDPGLYVLHFLSGVQLLQSQRQ